jgi:hypothetical protein
MKSAKIAILCTAAGAAGAHACVQDFLLQCLDHNAVHCWAGESGGSVAESLARCMHDGGYCAACASEGPFTRFHPYESDFHFRQVRDIFIFFVARALLSNGFYTKICICPLHTISCFLQCMAQKGMESGSALQGLVDYLYDEDALLQSGTSRDTEGRKLWAALHKGSTCLHTCEVKSDWLEIGGTRAGFLGYGLDGGGLCIFTRRYFHTGV